MTKIRAIASIVASAALCCAQIAAAAENVPPALAAKRAELARAASVDSPQATPSPQDMIFTPIAPCRAFSDQALAQNQTRNFQVFGGSLAGQGGPAAGCGVPAYARAVAVNLTVRASSAGGGLAAYAAGTARPGTTSISIPTTGTFATSGSTVQVSNAGAMSIYANRPARVYGDITGYYSPQIWAYINPAGTLVDSSGRIVSVTKNVTGVYTVTTDRNVTNCAATASSDITGYIESAYTSNNIVYVYVVDRNGTAQDYWVNLHVMC